MGEQPRGGASGCTFPRGSRENDQGPRVEEDGCACRTGRHRLGWLIVLRRRAKSVGRDLVVVGQPGGVLVAGPPGAVESLVARFVEVAGTGAWSGAAWGATDLVATAVSAGALVATHGEYLRLTARSIARLKELGLMPGEEGVISGVARDSLNRIRAHLDFEKISLGPQQALALQTAAVQLALRAAIAEVQAAVERVEGKVDDVLGLLRAERAGDVLGTKRMLDPLVDRARREGRVSTTDWSAVAALGADIARDHRGTAGPHPSEAGGRRWWVAPGRPSRRRPAPVRAKGTAHRIAGTARRGRAQPRGLARAAHRSRTGERA